MKKRSKIKSGFTLLETVISMMIITMLSIGVYNGFMLLIRNTKDGEVKQSSALIGKQVIEQIRSGEIEPDDGDSYYNKYGQEVSEKADWSYKISISKESQNVLISNGNSQKEYYVADNRITKDDKDISGRFESKIEKTILITCDENSYSDNKIKGKIKFDGESNEEDIDDASNIALNFKYLANDSKITVEIDNKSGKQINLIIINNESDRDGIAPKVEIKNVNGSLKKAYRSDDYNSGRNGMLYKITVKVSGKNSKGVLQDNLFEGDILKNIS